MLEYLSYILFFTTITIIFIYAYIRVKFGFWAVQPVFHVYDIGYMLKAPGIIDDYLPEKNKYTNFNNIDTIVFSELTSLQTQRFVALIRQHYLQNKDNIFSPQAENIVPYLSGHNAKTFVSLYTEDHHMMDLKKGTVVTEGRVIGAMTSRPVYVSINNGDADAKFTAYYFDYLCVDKSHRKKGVAPQLIQTHHYNQRRINKNIVVSLFKREDELTGIVPLCVYSTYGFRVDAWTKPAELMSAYKLVEVNAQNFHLLFNFMVTHSKKFDIIINTETANIIELIKTKNIFIYIIIADDNIVAAYFFRKSCVEVEKGMDLSICYIFVIYLLYICYIFTYLALPTLSTSLSLSLFSASSPLAFLSAVHSSQNLPNSM